MLVVILWNGYWSKQIGRDLYNLSSTLQAYVAHLHEELGFIINLKRQKAYLMN